MENMYCEKHQVLAAKIKQMANMGVIVDFPLCEQCDELKFGKVVYEDSTCWNEDSSNCCNKEA